jgi:hypothetical protein
MRFLVLLPFATFALLVPHQTLGQEPSGTTVGVIPAAAVSHQGDSRVLGLDDPIFMGDEVNTDGIGEVQIRFRDNSRVVVGPNSLLTIDRFVFNPDNTARDVALNYARGTFRFISGGSRPEAYSFRSPSMTIGIRGSAHDFSNGVFVLLAGSARLCHPTTGECVEVSEPCSVVVSDENGLRVIESDVERLAELQSGELKYVSGNQSTLEPDFRLDIPRICGIAPIRHANAGTTTFAGAITAAAALAIAAIVAESTKESSPVSPPDP